MTLFTTARRFSCFVNNCNLIHNHDVIFKIVQHHPKKIGDLYESPTELFILLESYTKLGDTLIANYPNGIPGISSSHDIIQNFNLRYVEIIEKHPKKIASLFKSADEYIQLAKRSIDAVDTIIKASPAEIAPLFSLKQLVALSKSNREATNILIKANPKHSASILGTKKNLLQLFLDNNFWNIVFKAAQLGLTFDQAAAYKRSYALNFFSRWDKQLTENNTALNFKYPQQRRLLVNLLFDTATAQLIEPNKDPSKTLTRDDTYKVVDRVTTKIFGTK